MTLTEWLEEAKLKIECIFIRVETEENIEFDKWTCRISNEISGRFLDVEVSVGEGCREFDPKKYRSNFYIPPRFDWAKLQMDILDRKDQYQQARESYKKYWVAVTPSLESAMDGMLGSVHSVVEALTFEDWAGEFGYDKDSRKAEKTYLLILEQTAQLRDVVGLKLFAQLLNEVELN